jgi:hypothetical protein
MKFATILSAMTTSLKQRVFGTVSLALIMGINPFFRTPSSQAQTLAYCHLSPQEIARKENLRQGALSGKKEDQRAYFKILTQHAIMVGECRRRTWPQTQAIWLRLYPCDVQPGAIDRILDNIANKGYNQVYLEVFYDGQVLLPKANNPTPWPSVIKTPGYEKVDLLDTAIKKGRQRGFKMYAWFFTMNFGYSYSLRQDRQQVLARNGKGQTTLEAISEASLNEDFADAANQVFVDPYNAQARQDYLVLVNEVLKRYPAGMLFDYVRYLRGLGGDSVASNVKHLWIYGDAAQQALLQRATNEKGRYLIGQYLKQGYVTLTDVQTIAKLYPKEKEPLWQGKIPTPVKPDKDAKDKPAQKADEKKTSSQIKKDPTGKLIPQKDKPEEKKEPLPDPELLTKELWLFSVNHARQGIIDFLSVVTQPAINMGLPVGAVFFPLGNQTVNEGGFDSRLQPWDKFPASMQFHPMAYGSCGEISCVLSQIDRVLKMGPQGIEVIPAISGVWGEKVRTHQSLEQQMMGIQNAFPSLPGVSHFAYAWQEPQEERQRQICRLQPR